MNKIEEFLRDSHNNDGNIDKHLLEDAVNEVLSKDLSEHVGCRLDDSGNVNEDLKRKVRCILERASEFVEDKSSEIYRINRDICKDSRRPIDESRREEILDVLFGRKNR